MCTTISYPVCVVRESLVSSGCFHHCYFPQLEVVSPFQGLVVLKMRQSYEPSESVLTLAQRFPTEGGKNTHTHINLHSCHRLNKDCTVKLAGG